MYLTLAKQNKRLPLVKCITTMANCLEQRRSSWSIAYARGCRHHLDVAPFSSWNTGAQDYTFPTDDQITWIFKNYNPSCTEWWSGYGFFTLFTDTPALLGHGGLVTLTIAGAPVIFVPRAARDTFETGPPMPNSMYYCNLSIPDPLPRFKVHRWTGPSIMEAQVILNHLNTICNVHALNFVLSAELYVELADDGRRYEPGLLPHYLAGWSTYCHHDLGDDAFWKDAIPMPQGEITGKEQLISRK
jgi:hypothetical protein